MSAHETAGIDSTRTFRTSPCGVSDAGTAAEAPPAVPALTRSVATTTRAAARRKVRMAPGSCHPGVAGRGMAPATAGHPARRVVK